MKILFCIYQVDFADHIAVSYLSAIAKNRGHQTHFCVFKDFESTLKTFRPDIVAFSMIITGFEEMLSEHKRLKSIYKYKSIAGGPQITFYPESFQSSGMDAYCVGEGEFAFNDYLERIERGQSYDDVPNLITPNAINEVRPWIKDLDTIPFPDRDLVLSNSILSREPKKTFYATRGCPYSCYYCANNYYNDLYKGKGKLIRRFSPERMVEEIKYVGKKHRMDFVKMGDDLFAFKADEWLHEFCQRYKKEVNIPFNCNIRIDTLNDDILKLLKEANCYSVCLSIDSTSESVREHILGRKMKKIDIENKLKSINSYGINTWVNFMLAAPGSTVEDDISIIDASYNGKVTYMSCTTTAPMKGTRLYDYSISNGLITHDYVSDMNDIRNRSPFLNLTKKEKDIRYNVFLLGPLAAILPTPFRQILKSVIRFVKPKKFFLLMRNKYLQYSLEHRIYKLK